MIIIKLTQEQYNTLMGELNDLGAYHWNDDRMHADECGSKVIGIIENNIIAPRIVPRQLNRTKEEVK